jgi:hypothetical protein
MIEQHRYHSPRKSKPRAAACPQKTLQDRSVCAHLLLAIDLKGYVTAACVGILSLWTKAK